MHQKKIRSAVHWTVPHNSSWSKYHSVLYCVFDHLSKTTCSCQRKGTWCTFSGWGPSSFSYKASAASYPHLNLDPNPRTVWCNNNNKKGTRYQLKENCKIQCRMGDNTFLPEFYLFLSTWFRRQRGTYLCFHCFLKLFILPFQNLFIFFQFIYHDILLSLAAHGVNELKLSKQNGVMLIKDGCHMILARPRSYHFPIG